MRQYMLENAFTFKAINFAFLYNIDYFVVM